MMSGMDRDMELAAFEGMARNPALPMADRVAMALQVIDGLNERIAELEAATRSTPQPGVGGGPQRAWSTSAVAGSGGRGAGRRCTYCGPAHTMDGDCILAEQDDDRG